MGMRVWSKQTKYTDWDLGENKYYDGTGSIFIQIDTFYLFLIIWCPIIL